MNQPPNESSSSAPPPQNGHGALPGADGNEAAAPAEEVPAGTVVGGCRIEEKIGQGGMGAVYRATQVALEKNVALKILPQRLAASDEFVERFLREARLAARLEHPNIVQVYDTGTDAGRSFIVMQFVAGETLRERVRRAGVLSITVALDYLQQATQGLSVAHKKKVVHRDVKPENLIVSGDGQLKVADFGLAQEETLTEEGDAVQDRVLASASFMSPEHADLQLVDARSDLYSLGVTFWALFAGRLAFSADSHLEWVLRHHLDVPLPVTWTRRDVPLTVAAILYRLMHKRPEQRYSSADELLDDLVRIHKKQLPRVPLPWQEGPLRTQRLDATSIVRGGLRRCLDIQRAMKERGDPLLPLGQIMQSNEFVRVVESEESYQPLDLPFFWPLEAKLPNLAEHPAGHPDERSMRAVAAEAREAEPFEESRPRQATWRLTRAPVAFAAAQDVLIVRPLAKLDDPVAVQHLYDAVLTYPFEGTPELWLDLGREAMADIEDVGWIVECQGLMKQLGGRLCVRSLDESSAAFVSGHRLHQYLPVLVVMEGPGVGEADDVSAADADEEGAAASLSGAASNEATTVTPLDEARALLAAHDPLAAKEVLFPLLHGKDTPPPGAYQVADEVVAAFLERAQEGGKAEDYETAKHWLDHAIDLKPQHDEALFRKALLLKKLNLLDSALQLIDEAIRLRSSDPELYYNRAIIRARAERLRDAVEDLTRAITLNPRHHNAYYNRGIAFERLGDFVRARNDFQIALKLNPRFQKVLGPRLKKLEQRINQASEGVVDADEEPPSNKPQEAENESSPPN